MTSRAYPVHQPVPRPDKISFPKDLSNIFLNIFENEDSMTSFSTSQIQQQITKNSEILSGLLVALRMNSNLPADLTGSSPKCRCPWCIQELDWGVYGKRDLNSITINSSLNPKEFYWYQWGYLWNILLSNMKKGTRICPFDKIDKTRRFFWTYI